MTYNLNWQDPASDPSKVPVTVPLGGVNTADTSLTLTGKGAANYGAIQQTNLLKLMEHFASDNAPLYPTVGQLWYDTSDSTLKICTSKTPETWENAGGTVIQETPPLSPQVGSTWIQPTGTSSAIFYIYTGLGRYPSTETTIGGWEQIHPPVDVIAGREEYDFLREQLETIVGPGATARGSGALPTLLNNLTNFAALDADLRRKFIQQTSDPAIFRPSSIDAEIPRQAISPGLLYGFCDYDSSNDNRISGSLTDVAAPGAIYINGILTSVSAGQFSTDFEHDKALIMWDRFNSLNTGRPFHAIRLVGTQWQYDTGVGIFAFQNFTPLTGQYAIGLFSSFREDLDGARPGAKEILLWGHAVELVSTGTSFIIVEPNSQDWDALLAAFRYATNRLDLPETLINSISEIPFVSDGRPAPNSLSSLAVDNIRFPKARRRFTRSRSLVQLVNGYSETVNVANSTVFNKFNIKGISGSSSINPTFAPTTTVELQTTANQDFTGPGGSFILDFNFGSFSELEAFVHSGAALEVVLSQTGTGAGPTNLQTLFAQNKRFRITADKTRTFSDSAGPPLVNQVSIGMWNATPGGRSLVTRSVGSASVNLTITRSTLTRLTLTVQLNAGANLNGTTTVVFNVITFSEEV